MAATNTWNIAAHLPAALTVPGLTDKQFAELCAQFPDAKVEYHSDGTVTIMPPTDPETSVRGLLLAARLLAWAEQQGGGYVAGPDGGFRFPGGSRLSADAAWFNKKRWQKARAPGKRYPVFAPEFVIELRSPDDRLYLLQAKMQEYLDNGVKLGWLIDPRERTVTIYRPGRQPKVLTNPSSVTGEGPVQGFVLNLDRIL